MRPRLTIRSIMIAVAVCAGLLGVARAWGGGLAVLLFMSCVLLAVTWRLLAGRPRIAGWCFLLVWAATAMIGLISNVYLGKSVMVIYTGILVLLLIPLSWGAGCAWAKAVTCGRAARTWWRLAVWPLVLVAGIAPLSIPLSDWPFRLAFRVSKPALDRLADRVGAGQIAILPARAGVFRVIERALDPGTGNVALFVCVEPGLRMGFVRLGAGSPSSRGPLHVFVHEMHMDGRWWYQEGD